MAQDGSNTAANGEIWRELDPSVRINPDHGGEDEGGGVTAVSNACSSSLSSFSELPPSSSSSSSSSDARSPGGMGISAAEPSGSIANTPGGTGDVDAVSGDRCTERRSITSLILSALLVLRFGTGGDRGGRVGAGAGMGTIDTAATAFTSDSITAGASLGKRCRTDTNSVTSCCAMSHTNTVPVNARPSKLRNRSKPFCRAARASSGTLTAEVEPRIRAVHRRSIARHGEAEEGDTGGTMDNTGED